MKTEKNTYQMYRSLMKSDKNMYQMFIGLLGCAKYKLLHENSILNTYVYPQSL